MEYKLSSEFKALLKYIKEELSARYTIEDIDIPTFMLGVMEFTECDAHKKLKSLMLSDDFESMMQDLILVHEEDVRSRGVEKFGKRSGDVVFHERFDEALKVASKNGVVDSVNFWLAMSSIHAYPSTVMSKYGVTSEQMSDEKKPPVEKKTRRREAQKKKKKNAIQEVKPQPEVTYKRTPNSVVEANLTSISEKAANGDILPVIGNGPIYDKIFTVWSRCDNNNVILVGKSGVGKTATVNHLANMIVNGDVPVEFRNKRLMLLNLAALMPPNGIKGAFEEKYKAIINEAEEYGGYIFFMDNLRSAIDDTAHYSDMGTELIMDMMLSNRNILFICTATEEDYSAVIEPNTFFKRRLKRVDIKEKTESECIDIVMATKKRLEDFHNVEYTEELVKDCVALCKRHIPSCVLPDTVNDVLDEVGAKYSVADNDSAVSEARSEVDRLWSEWKIAVDDPTKYNKDSVEDIETQIREKTRILNEEEKKACANDRKTEVSLDIMRKVVSDRCGKPVDDITTDEKKRLVGLENRIRQAVIGQDDAVDKVCRSVKRNRIGLKRVDKPSVFMFVGSTGTGKTYLSKMLAKEVFGDEKSMVRLDMGEYGDKTSVNKIYGSAPGYIGYEKGGVLTEAVKKNGYCVVLLDEIEKAAEEVHDTLLQVFDDGRLTDNKGVTVNFGNCIIIMTSNVGASEAQARGSGVGFVKDDALSDSIITNAIKRKFKPEFINRVDDIIMFNKLSDDNIKTIAGLEVDKALEMITNAGYDVCDKFRETAVETVLKNIETSEYGARPITNAVNKVIIDPVSDYILNSVDEDRKIIGVEALTENQSS